MEDETKNLIEKVLREIADDLIERYEKNELEADIGLFSGKTGISLFLFYYASYIKEEKYEEYAQKLLESVFDDINSGNLMPTYCSGLAGVGWTVDHLVEEGFIDEGNLKVLSDMDSYLINSMQNYLDRNDFDFLHGATGIAYYLRIRAPKNSEVKEALYQYVKKLSDYAIFDGLNNTVKIVSSVLSKDDQRIDVYNIGLAHGMASIIIVLCKLYYVVEERTKCLKLIEGMSNYMLLCEKVQNPVTFSRYPTYIEVDGNKNDSYGRLAWCYGDLNQGYCFLEASEVLQRENLRYKAIEVFYDLKNRKNIYNQVIKDAPLCHGSAGIALICSSLYHRTSDKLFEQLREYWISISLEFYKKSANIEGFSTATKDSYEYKTSLLNGTAGVGLMFLSSQGMKTGIEEILALY
jgi:lantibiotic modifying enzyme